MWNVINGSKSPVIVISSSAGGTGSGSMPVICNHIIEELGKHVIPIIVIPSKDDPVAYHLNTSDLLLELDKVGVETYGMFRNVSGERNYDPINEEIVDFIEIILGKRYHSTTSDSIDESDIDQLLKTPGRVMAVSAKATEINTLIRKLTKNMFAGFQPSWTDEEADKYTFMAAYSLRSMFAKTDFKRVFDDVRHRVKSVFDEYSHIEEDDNDGNIEATAIIAGLPRPSINDVDTEFNQADSIASGMKKAVRPSFMSRKSKSTFNASAKNGKINWDKH
jgi:cell division GTPase FtsZ